MATIEELERRSGAIYTAEGAALAGLAGAMRELAVELPEGSRLALLLAKHALVIDGFAKARGAQHLDIGFASVAVTANEIRAQQLQDWGARWGEEA